jgi:hypothetical protein
MQGLLTDNRINVMRTKLRTAALAATLLVAGVMVWALLLAPVVISIHRFMVLEEVTRTYVRPVGEPALQAQALGCTRERPDSNSQQCEPEFGAANPPPARAAVIAVTATDKSE